LAKFYAVDVVACGEIDKSKRVLAKRKSDINQLVISDIVKR